MILGYKFIRNFGSWFLAIVILFLVFCVFMVFLTALTEDAPFKELSFYKKVGTILIALLLTVVGAVGIHFLDSD